MLTIPFGKTRSYGHIENVPRRSARIGAANGRNPISIVVRCHRVIGSAGKLTGFAGGLERKAHLPSLERLASLLSLSLRAARALGRRADWRTASTGKSSGSAARIARMPL
ncbi:MAG: methylated-DNA--[protein]-cysteine S-methyltransferase [Methyloceanibacter sp.]